MKSLSKQELIFKRFFDVFVSVFILLFFGAFILFFIIGAWFAYGKNPIFKHKRLGLNKKEFYLYKIRTYIGKSDFNNGYGHFLRKTKLNELLQFVNVLKGDMSVVGPRPDTNDFQKNLSLKEQEFFYSIKPGVTGPASIFFIDEESISLPNDKDSQIHRKIAHEKVILNEKYLKDYSLFKDVKYLTRTIEIIFVRIVKEMFSN